MKISFSCVLLFVFGCANAAETTAVITAPLEEIALYPKRSAPATVVSLNETTVSSRIQAQVKRIPVKVGNVVDRGNTLAELDCVDYELATRERRSTLESLKAQIELAKRRLERTRQLTLKQSVSEELLDERESDLNVLQASFRGAEAQLDMALLNESRCIVKSPFRGLVVERISAVGQYVNIGTALLSIIDIDNLEISAQIISTDAQQIQASNELRFEQNNKVFPLLLRSVSGSINPETRNREVRLLFQTQQTLPGTAGKLTWIDKRPHIPGEYLVRRGEKLGVFTINNGIAVFVPVVDAQAGRASPIDLPKQTLIVIEGQFSLKENDSVISQN